MMKWFAFLLLAGCSIVGPSNTTTIDVSMAESSVGVTFYAESQPRDTVFYSMEWLLNDEWHKLNGTEPDGLAVTGLAFVGDVSVFALFKAWGRDAQPDSLWFRR